MPSITVSTPLVASGITWNHAEGLVALVVR